METPGTGPARETSLLSYHPEITASTGLSGRIPNFVKSRKKKQKERSRMMAGHGQNQDMSTGAPNSLPSHPFWWHTRIYPDNMGCRGENRPGGPTSMMPYVTDS